MATRWSTGAKSIFIQGINQINPIDVPAARRSGAEIKEILLPAWMAYANWGLSFGSVEAFYQFEWNNTSIDSCGTYWSVTSAIISSRAGVCNSATAFGNVLGTAAPGTASPLIAQYGSAPWLQANGLYVPLVKGKEPSNSGQFGLAFRFPIEKLDTEFGLYGMNIHADSGDLVQGGDQPGGPDRDRARRADRCEHHRPGRSGLLLQGRHDQHPHADSDQRVLGGRRGPAGARQADRDPVGGLVLGVSGGHPDLRPGTTASNIAGWSVSSELSYTADQPVQVNGNDLLLGGFLLVGPNAADSKKTYAQGTGGYLQGYDRFDKTQFQVNALKTYSNILGAENMLIIGEVGAQWNNVPDYTAGAVRYGRAFAWGYGSSPAYAATVPPTAGTTCSPTFAGLPVPVPAGTLYNPSPRGCKNDGYVTDFAWGYRLRVSMDYNNVFGTGVTMTPNVFWSQDVEGVSMDPAFIEDRSALNLGLRFNYNKRYQLDMNWVQFGNSGYDPLQDRDYYGEPSA